MNKTLPDMTNCIASK